MTSPFKRLSPVHPQPGYTGIPRSCFIRQTAMVSSAVRKELRIRKCLFKWTYFWRASRRMVSVMPSFVWLGCTLDFPNYITFTLHEATVNKLIKLSNYILRTIVMTTTGRTWAQAEPKRPIRPLPPDCFRLRSTASLEPSCGEKAKLHVCETSRPHRGFSGSAQEC